MGEGAIRTWPGDAARGRMLCRTMSARAAKAKSAGMAAVPAIVSSFEASTYRAEGGTGGGGRRTSIQLGGEGESRREETRKGRERGVQQGLDRALDRD